MSAWDKTVYNTFRKTKEFGILLRSTIWICFILKWRVRGRGCYIFGFFFFFVCDIIIIFYKSKLWRKWYLVILWLYINMCLFGNIKVWLNECGEW